MNSVNDSSKPFEPNDNIYSQNIKALKKNRTNAKGSFNFDDGKPRD